MQFDWRKTSVEIKGDWPMRWLFLAPDYSLYVDGDPVDRAGGPLLRPRLEATFEDHENRLRHIECSILSIAGIRPRCDVSIDGTLVESGRVSMENLLNPVLMLIIIVSTGIMLYLGPSVLQGYLPLGG